MRRHDLTDHEWTVIEPLLPRHSRGVPRVDDRRAITASSGASAPARPGERVVIRDDTEIARRSSVWMAMSEIFLDTELAVDRYRSIRRTLRTSGYDRGKLRHILEQEVAPVLYLNLLSTAGIWDGWEEDELRARVLARLCKAGKPHRPVLQRLLFRRFMEREWARIDPGV